MFKPINKGNYIQVLISNDAACQGSFHHTAIKVVRHLLWLCEHLISAHTYFPPQPSFKSLGHFILFQPTHCGSFHFSGFLPLLLHWTEKAEWKKSLSSRLSFSIILPLARRKSSSTYVITRLKSVSGQMKKKEIEECGERSAGWLRNVHTPRVPWALCLLQDYSVLPHTLERTLDLKSKLRHNALWVIWQRSNWGSKRKVWQAEVKTLQQWWKLILHRILRWKKKKNPRYGMSSFLNLKMTVQGKYGQICSQV